MNAHLVASGDVLLSEFSSDVTDAATKFIIDQVLDEVANQPPSQLVLRISWELSAVALSAAEVH
jgi:hypothetical protein